MAETKPRAVRLSDEQYDKIVREYGSFAEGIEYLLRHKKGSIPTEKLETMAAPTISKPMRKGKTPATWPYPEQVERWEQLLLPVGDLIADNYMNLWPINPVHRKLLVEAFSAWEGFALVWGKPESETCRCANRRRQPYFAGDMQVWCVVTDYAKALDKLKNDTQVLVPLQCDVEAYNSSPEYKVIYDLYHEYYVHYYKFGRPQGSDM